MQTSRIVLLVVFSGLLFICGEAQRDSKKTGTPEDTSSVKTQAITGKMIAPNHCRIIGTIVAIDKTLLSGDPADPYSVVPSRGTVRIDSVLGYGSAFPNPLAPGIEIQVFFKFTLSPTKNLFPDLTQEYPGLSVNSTFLADVEASEVFEPGKKSSVEYTIYGYEVK